MKRPLKARTLRRFWTRWRKKSSVYLSSPTLKNSSTYKTSLQQVMKELRSSTNTREGRCAESQPALLNWIIFSRDSKNQTLFFLAPDPHLEKPRSLWIYPARPPLKDSESASSQ